MDTFISAKGTSKRIETHFHYVMSFSAMNEAPAYVTGPLRSFHKSSYERFSL